jgi:hypothetical protein
MSTSQTVHVKIHNYDETYHNIQVSFSTDTFVEPEGQETIFAYDLSSFQGETMDQIMKELSIFGYFQVRKLQAKQKAVQNVDLIQSIKDSVGTKTPNEVGHLEAKLGTTLPGYALNQTLVDFLPSFEIDDTSL